jgi:phosphoserine aminotransferase
MKPSVKPGNANFSSGPCCKRPGYDVAALQLNTLGRSHRSALGKSVLEQVCTRTAAVLGLPPGYR